MRIWLLLYVMSILAGCAPAPTQPAPNAVCMANLGQRLTVEGWAVNRKNGAQLLTAKVDVWIDGLASWPPGYYSGGEKGRKVRVTGILAADQGLPVFIPSPAEPPVQGLPVPPGTDLAQAGHRYLLKQAHWELLPE
jgi:hypothetical protein